MRREISRRQRLGIRSSRAAPAVADRPRPRIPSLPPMPSLRDAGLSSAAAEPGIHSSLPPRRQRTAPRRAAMRPCRLDASRSPRQPRQKLRGNCPPPQQPQERSRARRARLARLARRASADASPAARRIRSGLTAAPSACRRAAKSAAMPTPFRPIVDGRRARHPFELAAANTSGQWLVVSELRLASWPAT